MILLQKEISGCDYIIATFDWASKSYFPLAMNGMSYVREMFFCGAFMKAQRKKKTQTYHDDKSGPSYLVILRKIVTAFVVSCYTLSFQCFLQTTEK